jgi:hypothetical protein
MSPLEMGISFNHSLTLEAKMSNNKFIKQCGTWGRGSNPYFCHVWGSKDDMVPGQLPVCIEIMPGTLRLIAPSYAFGPISGKAIDNLPPRLFLCGIRVSQPKLVGLYCLNEPKGPS